MIPLITLRLFNNLSEIVNFNNLPICLLGNLNAFLSSAVFFFKINFFENVFQEYLQSIKQIESRSVLTLSRA